MKKELSTNSVIRQYQFEVENWGRLLSFQKEELVYFKTRLAEVVNGSVENDQLLAVENFQEDFLGQEKVIGYLLEELRRQTKQIEKELYLDDEVFKLMLEEQKKLRREFHKAEELFNGVKCRFIKYLVNLY